MSDVDSTSDTATLVSSTNSIKGIDEMAETVQLTNDGARARTPSLPIELYYYILSCARRDIFFRQYLRSLMGTSRAWHSVVEPEFYKDVEVGDGRILIFCDTIDARPDLAPHIRSLFYRRGIDRPPLPDDYTRVHALLRNLSNLIEIRDELSNPRYPYQLVSESDTGYLLYSGLPRLERLSTTLRFKPIMAEVLCSLPKLREFSNAHMKLDPSHVPSGVLSSCTVLRAGPKLLRALTPPYPPLQHLTFKWPNFNTHEEGGYPEEICLVGEHLKSLCIYRVSHDFNDYISMPMFVRRFAHATPNLVQFAILDGFDFSPRDNMQIRKLVTQHFRKLQVYIWIPRFFALTSLGFGDWDTDEEEGDVVDPDADDDEPLIVKEERYASMHFRDIPTLRYFIAGEWEHRMYKRIPTGDGSQFRLERLGCMARLDLSHDMVHFIDPDRPEDYLLHRIPSYNHYRPPTSSTLKRPL